MHDKFSPEVVELANQVVKQLNTNPGLNAKYKNILPGDDLLTRVCDYGQTLPIESQKRLLGVTQDENGHPKIKGQGLEQLADTIARGFASYNKSGNYTDEEHRKALFNFRVLQQSKFNDNVVSLGEEIVKGLTTGKATLNYHPHLTPVLLSTILATLNVETKDLAEQKKIIGLTIGMISAIASPDSPFAAELRNKQTLPPELIVAIHESAVELAKDPKYNTLDQNGVIAAGKRIGKEVARKVAKYEFDNGYLASRNETIDTEAIKNSILQGVKKPNYMRLQENKKQTKAFIEAHAGKEPTTPNTQEIYNEVRGALKGLRTKDFDGIERRLAYSAIIDALEEARDNEFGIVWSRSAPHHDGSRDLIRDARNATTITESPVSFALQAISSIRAMEKIIEQEINDPQQKALAMKQLEEQMDKVLTLLPQKKGEQVQDINIKEFNFELVNILENAGVKNGIKKISVAKELLSFDDPQYHVTTINRIPGRSELMIESNTMLLGLTDSQKEQYEAIAAALPGQPVICKAYDMEWYNKLPDFDKALIKGYAGQIAAGNCILPNQLTKQLIGLRNAYSKATFIHTEAGELELLDEGLHSSTVSFHGKGNKQQVVNENIEQVRSFLPAGQEININTLNSPGNPSGIEREICKQISASQKSVGGYRSLTPFALWRIFPGNANNNSGYEKALTEIARGLGQDKSFENLANFLKTGKNESEARQEIQELAKSDLRLAKVLEHALEAKKLIDGSGKRKLLRGDTDPDNGNLSLSVRMRIISHAANKGVLSKYFTEHGIVVDISTILRHCKSGKDRTGLAEMETTRIAILNWLGITDYTEKPAQEIFQAQVNGGHTQFITSVNGGSTGTHGVKSDSKTAIPKHGVYKDTKGIILETASFNKFKVKKPRFHAVRKLFTGRQNDLADTSSVASEYQGNSPASLAQPIASQVANTEATSLPQTQHQPAPYQPQNTSGQYQPQASSPSGSKLSSKDITDSQTDSYQDFKTSRNVALGAVSLLLAGIFMGGGFIVIFLLVAMVAGGFAMDSKQKMQQEKQQIATQMNIENANKAYAMQKSSEQSPKISASVSRNSAPTTVHRQRLKESRNQPLERQP